MKQQNEVIVTVELSDNNYSSYIDILPGCVSTGSTFDELKNNMEEAVKLHLQGMREDNEKVNKAFDQDNYELIYKFDMHSLLIHYSGIFSMAALERLSGINQRQIQRYLSGESKPREQQSKRLSSALHKLGNELLEINL